MAIPMINRTVVGVLALFCAMAYADENPEQLIEELNLKEAQTPSREYATWQQPRQIGVFVPGSMSERRAEILAAASEAAPGANVFPFDGGSMDTVSEADVLLAFCSPRMLEAAPKLRWMHSYSVGVDRCMLSEDIDKYEFVLTNNQRLSGPDIAEHTLGLMFALTRNLDHYSRAQEKKHWDRDADQAININGKTLLILGLGGIGTEIAWRADALGMNVLATRNSSREGPDFVSYVGLSDEMYELAAKSDVIVNALPLTAGTQNLIDARFFASAKPGALYINVGRGGTTNTDALVSALESGQLGGAGLDVTAPEPLPASHQLWTMENVVITPHVAAYTDESFERTLAIALENLGRYYRGEALLNVVDFEKGY